jgi:hypothetical protein
MGNENRRELEEARQQLARELDSLVKASGDLLEPLKGLDESQIAAVVTLGFAMRVVMLAGRPAAKIDRGILTQLEETIYEVCPPLGSISISRDPCLEASIQYAQALKECQDEGRDEDNCPEAWGYGGQTVMCAMKEVEEMKRQIEDILGGMEPPRPFPWPE